MEPQKLLLPSEQPADFAAVESPSFSTVKVMWNLGVDYGRDLLAEIEREKNREAGREQRN